MLQGDGWAGYTPNEFDTFTRLARPVITAVGNDARPSRMAGEQEMLLGDPAGTVLPRTDYQRAAEGSAAGNCWSKNPLISGLHSTRPRGSRAKHTRCSQTFTRAAATSAGLVRRVGEPLTGGHSVGPRQPFTFILSPRPLVCRLTTRWVTPITGARPADE